MTAGTGKILKPSSVTPSKEVIFQLREITGKSPEQVRDAYLVSNGDMKRAVAILTGNHVNDSDQVAGPLASANDQVVAKVNDQKEVIEISDDKDDDLAKAIELSLREAQSGFGPSISEEDREISKALEASLVDSRGGNKRKRDNLWMSFIDPENPHDRERKEGVPVGLKNIGNTCWFSAVIQSLFHLPKFRNLVLNCELPADNEKLKDQPKLAFLLELQKLFSLLLRSKRKYVDPAKPIEILEDAIRGSGKENAGDQQDVSEFTHVLLDWLEDAFKAHSDCSDDKNPIAELFYGRYTVNGCYNGKEVKNEEKFGALPLHIRGHEHIYDGLDDAMVNDQIKTNDSSTISTQEHWFTHLPRILTFELSRFIFNHQFSKAEKIHDHFYIDQTIHLARYMEHNKEITREKRRLVERAKRKRRELLLKLEKYICFGSGTKRNSIMATLDGTLEFIRKGLNENDQETPMSISPGSSPQSNSIQESSNCTLTAAEGIEGPSPKSMTSEEGNIMIDCLQRWRTEIDKETETLRRGIEYIDEEIKQAYNEECFKQVPYRLHAILVHEGQANGGHYWSYIFDSTKKVWRKFNDITVAETTWDEVQRESSGGFRNTCAYCLVYVDAGQGDLFDSLEEEMPRSIQAYVENDNKEFDEEIESWEAKQRKMDTSTDEAGTGNKDSNPTSMDGISFQPKDQSLDEQLNLIFVQNCARLTNNKSNNDIMNWMPGLESISSYFHESKAPKQVLYYGFLEYFIDATQNQDGERMTLMQHHAKWKLKKIEDNESNLKEFLQWKCFYKTYLRCSACFVNGLETYFKQRYRESFPCFFLAMKLNNQLINAECKPAHMNGKVLSYFRRKCIEFVNNEACKLFESENLSNIEEGFSLMKELVIPSLPNISESEILADLSVAESLRERWCTYVGVSDVHERKSELLQEIIMGLVEGNDGSISMKPASIKGPVSGIDLLKRCSVMMEEIKKENIDDF